MIATGKLQQLIVVVINETLLQSLSILLPLLRSSALSETLLLKLFCWVRPSEKQISFPTAFSIIGFQFPVSISVNHDVKWFENDDII